MGGLNELSPQPVAPSTHCAPWPKSPRGQRVLTALLSGPLMREQVDHIAGASNGPQTIAGLRKLMSLAIPCEDVPARDRDGHSTRPGRYALSTADRARVLQLQLERERLSLPCPTGGRRLAGHPQ